MCTWRQRERTIVFSTRGVDPREPVSGPLVSSSGMGDQKGSRQKRVVTGAPEEPGITRFGHFFL